MKIKYIAILLNKILFYLYIKASDLLILGQLKKDNSLSEKRYLNGIFQAILSMTRKTNPYKQIGGFKVPNYLKNINCILSIFFNVINLILKYLRAQNFDKIFTSAGGLRMITNVLIKNSGNPDC